jgi:hypothetical protein
MNWISKFLNRVVCWKLGHYFILNPPSVCPRGIRAAEMICIHCQKTKLLVDIESTELGY